MTTESIICIIIFSIVPHVKNKITYMEKLLARACNIPIKLSNERKNLLDEIKSTSGRKNSTMVVARAAPNTSNFVIKMAFSVIWH